MGELQVELSCHMESSHGEGGDRIAVLELPGARVLVVADGAGNSRAGRLAAEAVLEAVRAAVLGMSPAALRTCAWDGLLLEVDRRLCRSAQGGQTTAVVLCIAD